MKKRTSKILYFITVTGMLTVIAVMVGLNSYAINNGKNDMIISFSIFNALLFLPVAFYVRRFIYLEFKGKEAEYGTIFFKRKVNLSKVGEPKRVWFMHKGYRIEIDGKKYYFIATN